MTVYTTLGNDTDRAVEGLRWKYSRASWLRWSAYQKWYYHKVISECKLTVILIPLIKLVYSITKYHPFLLCTGHQCNFSATPTLKTHQCTREHMFVSLHFLSVLSIALLVMCSTILLVIIIQAKTFGVHCKNACFIQQGAVYLRQLSYPYLKKHTYIRRMCQGVATPATDR